MDMRDQIARAKIAKTKHYVIKIVAFLPHGNTMNLVYLSLTCLM